MINITIIGTGRLSFHLMNEILNNKSLHLNQIYGRSKFRPKNITDEVEYVKKLDGLKNSDFYFIAVSDNEIEKISKKLSVNDGIVVHSSGTTDISVLSNHNHYGVFYPLQSFSYNRKLKFKKIPILIEGNTKKNLLKIKSLTKLFSKKVYTMNSKKRLICHLSATIANNFTNHMIMTAEKILNDNKINSEILKPIIKETFNKLNYITTREAQTGPAIRNDYLTIEKHLKELTDSDFLNLYKQITKNIKSDEF